MAIRDRDRLYAIAAVALLVTVFLLAVAWFATSFLGWVMCPCG